MSKVPDYLVLSDPTKDKPPYLFVTGSKFKITSTPDPNTYPIGKYIPGPAHVGSSLSFGKYKFFYENRHIDAYPYSINNIVFSDTNIPGLYCCKRDLAYNNFRNGDSDDKINATNYFNPSDGLTNTDSWEKLTPAQIQTIFKVPVTNITLSLTIRDPNNPNGISADFMYLKNKYRFFYDIADFTNLTFMKGDIVVKFYGIPFIENDIFQRGSYTSFFQATNPTTSGPPGEPRSNAAWTLLTHDQMRKLLTSKDCSNSWWH